MSLLRLAERAEIYGFLGLENDLETGRKHFNYSRNLKYSERERHLATCQNICFGSSNNLIELNFANKSNENLTGC